jgi:hypothetical protein
VSSHASNHQLFTSIKYLTTPGEKDPYNTKVVGIYQATSPAQLVSRMGRRPMRAEQQQLAVSMTRISMSIFHYPQGFRAEGTFFHAKVEFPLNHVSF